MPLVNHEPPIEFPMSLRSLELRRVLEAWPQTSLFAISQLSSLTRLVCEGAEVLKHLPPSLTDVTIGPSTTVKAQDLFNLPRGLLRFSCSIIDSPQSCFSFWPPSLTHLCFESADTDHIPPMDSKWLQLPKSLTELQIRPIDIYLHPTVLPPSITEARYLYDSETEILDYSHLKRLFTLQVYLNRPSPGDFAVTAKEASSVRLDYMDTTALESERSLSSLVPAISSIPQFCFILPAQLTKLDWVCYHQGPERSPIPDSWYFRDSFASLLPASLRTFCCDDARYLTNSFIELLPKHLGSLVLEVPKQIPVLLSGDGFKALPPYLSNLQCPVDSNSDDSFIQFLPRSLLFLRIPRLQILNDSSVRLLPRGLRTLHLRQVAHGLTDASIKDLPKTLKTLHLEHNKTWTPEAFFAHSLPKLTSLDLRANPKFTKAKVTPHISSRVKVKLHKYTNFI